ncbi:MAG: hypothetical protein EOQ95_25125 [Mesorhizobium sp.]|nr:MAG: hypothetical protein EOQ95_25125 [Mesorhizobium sp.]RWQ53148.1 MAG: hypothetical protein EOS84_15810 [Mesorhizobium sp.]
MPASNYRPWRRPSSACRHLLPVNDGEKGQAPALATPSPRCSRGEGKGEGQREPGISGSNINDLQSPPRHHGRRAADRPRRTGKARLPHRRESALARPK